LFQVVFLWAFTLILPGKLAFPKFIFKLVFKIKITQAKDDE